MQLITNDQIKKVFELRRWLHQHPELSGKEKETSLKIKKFLEQTNPDGIISSLGGYGLAAIYVFDENGPTIMARADMDALPINEINTFNHKSLIKDVSHKCGHDGHSASLAALALALKNHPLKTGRIVLLFQPAEETGAGAYSVLTDEAFKMIQPDIVLGWHNLPGYEQGTLVIKDGCFAAASAGMIIEMEGKSSHAAYPEHGNSPSQLLADLIHELPKIADQGSVNYRDFALLTIIHARLGEIAFGTNPSNALLMCTLRTFDNEDMILLKRKAENLVKQKARESRISISISYTEEFPATINNTSITEEIKTAALKAEENIQEISEPFRWSEDFGHFTNRYSGCMFGIGAGKDIPDLHSNDYDFPDEIIPSAITILYNSLVGLTDSNR